MVTRTRITSTMFLSLSNELVQITFMSTIHSSMIWVEQYSLPECIYIGVWIKMAQFVMNNPWIIIVGLSFLISRVSVWEDWTMMAQFVTDNPWKIIVDLSFPISWFSTAYGELYCPLSGRRGENPMGNILPQMSSLSPFTQRWKST